MTLLVDDADLKIYQGLCLDVLRELEDDSVDACVTSPPYLDTRPEYPSPTPEEFSLIFIELRRVVRGPFILNVGRIWRDKREMRWWGDLLDRAEFVGWPLSDTLVWVKGNPNPIKGGVLTDAHEYCFLLGDPRSFNTDEARTPYAEESIARMKRKWVNGTSVKGNVLEKDGRTPNPLGARARSVFQTDIGREKGNPHPAPMALDLAKYLVVLATTAGGTIIDPFGGSGNTAVAARSKGRKSILIELSSEYAELAAGRLSQQSLLET